MFKDYAVGQVAKLLSGKSSATSSKETKKAASLSAFFDVSTNKHSAKSILEQKNKDSDAKVRMKRKKSNVDEGFSPPTGVVHEQVARQLLEERSQAKSKKRKNIDDEDDGIKTIKRKRDKTSDDRTLFIGNLPISANKKTLTRLFATYGKIENVRFRSAAPANLKLPQRVACIKKEFHPERHNINAYVCFKDKEAAIKATELNGHEIDGLHLRVDISRGKRRDQNRTVFIGNLPFGIEEEAVYQHFSEVGEIENVRLIRDRKMKTGKGFGYVMFKEKDSVGFALNLNKSELKGRELRVMRSTDNPTHQEETTSKDKKRKFNTTASNISSGTFQGIRAQTNKKLKQKKKRKKFLSRKDNAEHAVKRLKDKRNKY